MRFITRVLAVAFALLVAAEFVPGLSITGLGTALGAAVILGILNALIRPVLIILTLPVTILTLGLFIFVINAALLSSVAFLLPGFAVADFWSALLGSLIVSVVSWIVNRATTDSSS
jgi:putative membrane protein